MKDQFYIVLPSNSSMKYFPDNTTTHFVTQLPHPIRLQGNWTIALTEIQIPMTFQHISNEGDEKLVILETVPNSNPEDIGFVLLENQPHSNSVDVYLKKSNIISSTVHPGIYSNINTLLDELNNLDCVKSHLEFVLGRGGYINIKRVCVKTTCQDSIHYLKLSKKLSKILGFDLPRNIVFASEETFTTSDRPANLSNGFPTMLMVYTDICEPYVTGDVHTRLLRAVSLSSTDYAYGSTKIKSFSPGMYLPLLYHSFQTIEIDIRDQHGDPLPFDCGTLAVTLHLKRMD